MMMGGLHTAGLRGPDHLEYGAIATHGLSDRVALAISIGQHPKGYPAVDPNEDGVFAAVTERTSLLAVVDGHNGFDAAAATLDAIEEGAGVAVDTADAEQALATLVASAHRMVRDRVGHAPPERRGSGTALALAVVEPEGTVTAVVLGDCVVWTVDNGKVRSAPASGWFLRHGDDLPSVRTQRFQRGHTLILASDGLSDFLGEHWQRHALTASAYLNPTDIARSLVEVAFAGGAGDNVTVAVAKT